MNTNGAEFYFTMYNAGNSGIGGSEEETVQFITRIDRQQAQEMYGGVVQTATYPDGSRDAQDIQTLIIADPADPSNAASILELTSNPVEGTYMPMDPAAIPTVVADLILPENLETPEQMRQREERLLKNRQAARECRLRKKHYVKSLENRVAELELQNRALVNEMLCVKSMLAELAH